ncbi:MAG TPA: ABC transporter substrate-binding protein [Chloroflexota bacterium]
MKRFSVFLLAGLLAACGGAAPASSVAPAPASPSAAAKPASAAPSQATSAKPAASVAASAKPAASAGAPVKIGMMLPLTGPLSPISKDEQDGFNGYLATINNSVAGRPIQITNADTQGQADVGLAKAKQLVEGDKVDLLAGIVATPVCYAVAPYVKQVQIPLVITADCGAQGLTTDPKFASPYLSRWTETNNEQFAPPADWAYKQGYRKAIVMTSDFGAGIEISDAFSSIFIERGGTVIQELHPALGTNDFGPFLAQLDKSADVLALFLPGTDGLHFAQQYQSYIDAKKLPMIDMGGPITDSSNFGQLGDKATDFASAVYNWSAAVDNPVNQAFVKAWQQDHNGVIPPTRVATSYANAEILVAALQKVNGDVSDKQKFLDALYATDVQTVKGPVKLDKYHDIVQNMYMYKVVKNGSQFAHQLLATYDAADQFWGRTPDQSMHFPYGKLKGKWAGMTKADLDKQMQVWASAPPA